MWGGWKQECTNKVAGSDDKKRCLTSGRHGENIVLMFKKKNKITGKIIGGRNRSSKLSLSLTQLQLLGQQVIGENKSRQRRRRRRRRKEEGEQEGRLYNNPNVLLYEIC